MLKDHEDAYGRAAYDHFMGKPACEIVERDDGWIAPSGGPAGYLSEFGSWPPRQKEAMRYAKGRVLDIGCGAGRHSLHLQQKDHDVLGIDVSPAMIKVCKLRGLKDARVLAATRIGPALGKFDTILMLGNNFGLFGSRKRARWLLGRLSDITNAGARLIAESRDPYQTDVPEHLDYHRRNLKRGRMAGQLRIRIRYGRRKTPWQDYLLVSRDEMEELLEGTGWAVKRFLDGGAEYVAIVEKE